MDDKMLTRVLKPIVRTALMLGLGINFSLAQAESNNLDVHIGIYAPFSNKQAYIGRSILNAMEMARDKTAQTKIHYSFYTLDTLPKNDARTTATLKKFIDRHKINVLVSEGSNNGLLLMPMAQKNNLLHFSMASDPRIADGRNNFLAWSPEYEQAMVMVKTLQQKKIKEIALISTDERSDQVLAQSVLRQLNKGSGIKVALQEEIKSSTRDYAALIQKLKTKNPELYLIMATPERIEKIQAAMKEAKLDKPVSSIVDQVTPTVMKVFNGQWYVDTHAMTPEFINEYQEINQNYPSTEAGYAYDVFNMVNASLEASLQNQAGFSVAAIAQQIHQHAPGQGVMGPFNFNTQGVLYTQSEVKTIKDGLVKTA